MDNEFSVKKEGWKTAGAAITGTALVASALIDKSKSKQDGNTAKVVGGLLLGAAALGAISSLGKKSKSDD